ncbi:MAG: HAMP domain-containing protein [Spirochaetes bacterium]|nr:MAG: HAMP domain-containing protein [Spirochaetota bacterium]
MKITIKKLLIFASITILLVVIGLGLMSFTFEKGISSQAGEAFRFQDESLFFKSRLIDHLSWVNNLQESISMKKPFTGELDYHKCGLGKWYYSFKGSPAYLSLGDEQRGIIDAVEPFHIQLHESAAKIIAEENKAAAITIYANETKKNLEELRKLFDRHMAINDDMVKVNKAAMEGFSRTSGFLTITVILVLAALLGFGAVRVIRSITHSISVFSGGFSRAAEGDLTTSIELGSRDELGMLSLTFNDFIARVGEAVREMKEMAVTLTASSATLSSASVTFAETAQTQAANSEEITATVEEISAGMDSVANHAEEQFGSMGSLVGRIGELSRIIIEMGEQVKSSLDLSRGIAEKAKSGEATLAGMSDSMAKIRESSTEMTGILNIIGDISDKINLLSLNAAIEAARAGDAGRGFAVVADEISKLADQTASSVKEIGNLVRVNEQEIVHGKTDVEGTVSVISEIISGVGSVSTLMASIYDFMRRQMETNDQLARESGGVKERAGEIRNATAEQKTAVTEIVKSISNISALTQGVASNAEEISGNAEEISGMAETLKRRVDYFRV